MRITYVGKHNSGGNDDEGAILYSLQKLGHNVDCIHERKANQENIEKTKPDLVLCHGWSDMATITQLKIPKIFWYFDLVEYQDPSLDSRNKYRRSWAIEMMRYCELGFFTDGDFARLMNRYYPGRGWHLPQGFDERLIKPFQPCQESHDIVFFGNEKGGKEREKWLEEMKKTWGNKFHHYRRGIYREEMRKKILEFKITIAPSSPITDSYWSNRVYLITGFGGFHLHPHSEKLYCEFGFGLQTYWKENQDNLIRNFLDKPGARNQLAEFCHSITTKNLTYTDRVSQMLEITKAKLNIG